MVDVYALFIPCGSVAVSLLQFDFWLKIHGDSSLARREFTLKFPQIQGVTAGHWKIDNNLKKLTQKIPNMICGL